MSLELLRRFFRILNKWFMTPIFRLGLGPFIGNPLSGYIMVLKTIGKKSGKLRYTPVNYAIHQGDLYCIAGWGKRSDWIQNILANPTIEVIHPNGPLAGACEMVADPVNRITIIRKILKNAGFAGFLEGFNPFTITDEELDRKLEDRPLIRIHPIGLGNGAFDPAGWVWLWMVSITILLILILIRLF